jgi:hypothetical protein
MMKMTGRNQSRVPGTRMQVHAQSAWMIFIRGLKWTNAAREDSFMIPQSESERGRGRGRGRGEERRRAVGTQGADDGDGGGRVEMIGR